MSTSVHKGTILYDPSELGADRFVDTGIVRDGVVNSAMHRADSAAQPVIAWSAPSSAVWEAVAADPHLVPLGDLIGAAMRANTWYPFPLSAVYVPKVRASGAAYRLRVAIAGRSSAGHAVDFAVVVIPRQRALSEVYGTFGDWPSLTYSSVGSTTVVELSSDTGLAYIDPGRAVVDDALLSESWSTLTDLGGDAIAVRVPVLSVAILGRTSDVASTPELYAASIHEVIGT